MNKSTKKIIKVALNGRWPLYVQSSIDKVLGPSLVKKHVLIGRPVLASMFNDVLSPQDFPGGVLQGEQLREFKLYVFSVWMFTHLNRVRVST